MRRNFIANSSVRRNLSVKYINKYSYPEFLNRTAGYAAPPTKFKLNHKCLPWNNEILSTPTRVDDAAKVMLLMMMAVVALRN